MKILPLKGYRALKALNAFNALLLGLKMLPIHLEKSYVEFFEGFRTKTDAEKETMIRQAVAFVPLNDDEIEALISFTTDRNGVPFGKSNVNNLSVEELHSAIVAVCMEIGKIKIDLVTEEEKKN
jgi:hypothetical protein